jgi:hypothetical protein
MRFVADESCDFSVVRALRGADCDVTAIAEIAPRVEDNEGLTAWTCPYTATMNPR